MRNIRARRRFRAVLIFLLLVSAIAFFENRVEAFAPGLKGLAEDRIEGIFGENFGISIGSVDGGIIHSLTLRDVSISGKGAGNRSRLFDIRSMVSNYHIWDFIFPKSFKRAPRVTIDFETKNREISAYLTFEGAVDNVAVRGYVNIFGAGKVNVEGCFKNGMVYLTLRPKTGLIKVESNFAANGVLLAAIKINHFKLGSLDIAGDVVIKNIAVKDAARGGRECFEGEIEAKNVILNYKPFFDLKSSYRISKENLEVLNLDVGGMFYLSGKFGLSRPHLMDAVALTDNMNLSQVFSVIDTRHGSFVSGIMNSKWELKGAAENLKSNIRVEIKNGHIGEMNFEYLSASLKGDGRMIRIEDSRITRESGPLVLGGEMDLRRIGKDSIFENIKILGGENTIAWDRWDTAKWQDVREFKMTKNVVGGFDVGFKKFVNDDKVGESLRERDQFELGYRLHPNDSIKLKFGDNSNFFGLEHKDKF
jgi:hypothetical protein